MVDKWGKAEEAAKKAASGGKYVRLQNDKDKVVGVFVGEPNPREFYYDEAEKKTYPYTEEHRKAGKKSTLKIAVNFFILSENGVDANRMAIYEMGPALFKDLIKVREKYGLEKWAFEVERHGSKGDTKTTYSILPEVQFTAEQRKLIEAAELHNLEDDGGTSGGGGSSSIGDYDKDAEGVVDEKTAKAIVDRLKALPREAANEFLKKFDIAKVKELPAAKKKAALEFVSNLESGNQRATEDDDDPFS